MKGQTWLGMFLIVLGALLIVSIARNKTTQLGSALGGLVK